MKVAIFPRSGFLIFFAAACQILQAQANEWTWMSGISSVTSSGGQPGVYGTLGTPAAGNVPGGRSNAAGWTDSSGNLWLFGGLGVDSADNQGYLNDLWEYSPSLGQWAWMGGDALIGKAGIYGTLGTPASANIPGGRYAAAYWTDKGGNFWLFGGYGFDSAGTLGELNDLWEFNPATVEWTWMGGGNVIGTNCPTVNSDTFCGLPGTYGNLASPAKGNIPGGRDSASVWTDSSGNFWLFGGKGFDSISNFGDLNDLWEYTPATGEWTWMAGSSALGCWQCGIPGTYGTLGTPASGNVPGSREGALSWTDGNGHLWLFGGYGFASSGEATYLDDSWMFDPSVSQWTWVGGSNTRKSSCVNTSECGQPGVYGTLGVQASTNYPGSRLSASSWTDSAGLQWIFGGETYFAGQTLSLFNNLFVLNPSNGNWGWMGGGSTQDTTGLLGPGEVFNGNLGVYGTLGTPAAGNVPGSRAGATTWTDKSGNFWLFGGNGIVLPPSSFPQVEMLDDLWSYRPSATSLPPAITPFISPPTGTYTAAQTVTISEDMSNASIYYTTDGSVPTSGSTLYSSPFTVSTTETVTAIALAKGYPESGLVSATYTIPTAAATPIFSIPGGTYGTAQTLTISDTTPGATIYYTTDGTTPTASSAQYSGAITVAQTETIQAIADAPNYSTSQVASATYTITPPQAAATPTFTPAAGTYSSVQNVTVSTTTNGAAIYYTTDGTTPTTSSTQYAGPIVVPSSETIRAIATGGGYSASQIASATYTINLLPPAFTLTTSAPSLTINSGASGNVILTVTPQNGFNAAVTFACSGLPTGATCSFSPSTVTPSGSAVNTTLTIAASASASVGRPARNPLLPAATLALAGCLLFFGKRRAPAFTLILIVAVVALGSLTACGGSSGGGGGGVQPTTSTVTVTATSGSQQQSTMVTLTLN